MLPVTLYDYLKYLGLEEKSKEGEKIFINKISNEEVITTAALNVDNGKLEKLRIGNSYYNDPIIIAIMCKLVKLNKNKSYDINDPESLRTLYVDDPRDYIAYGDFGTYIKLYTIKDINAININYCISKDELNELLQLLDKYNIKINYKDPIKLLTKIIKEMEMDIPTPGMTDDELYLINKIDNYRCDLQEILQLLLIK